LPLSIEEEMSHFVRNDSVGVSSRAAFARDLLLSVEEGYALLQLHPKTKTEEMSHFVRHETIKSLFGVSWEGVSPSHYVSPRTQ